MKIHFGTDHAGCELRDKLVEYVKSLGHEVHDYGSRVCDPTDDYPDFIKPVAEHVLLDLENNRGIILGGSGEGEAMVANRYKGIRATTYYAHNLDIIKLSREHNNANILSLGARFLTEEEAKEAVKVWLETSFSNEERHLRRIKKIDE